MKRTLALILVLSSAWVANANEFMPWMVAPSNAPMQLEAGCPSFPSVLYGSLVYNVGCIPWNLEFSSASMSGDVTGATYQWYRYKESEGASTAQPCSWQTDYSTFEGFKPATDEMNSRYIYYCKVTTPNCPNGVNSGNFTVVVGQNNDPCPTFSGTTFTITSGGSSYTSGQTVTITATTTAYGGDHVYTWYHNGEALDTTDTRYQFVWGFNQPQLIITNVQPADGGMYSVQMQDGTECYMYTDPVRILVDNPTCGTVPTLGVQKNAICEGESTQTGVSGGTLASGEVGELVYMVKPDGSNPSTTIGAWTTDLPGLYQFKYIINNPNNPSCYRESKVMTIRVYPNGGTLTITPDASVIKTNNKVTFSVSPAPGADETATVTFTSNTGQSGSVYPNTYPNFAHTCYNSGTYTYTYTITNTKAGCSRTATCEVMWYSCGWVTARFNNWVADKIKLGNSINLGPAVPTETGMIGVLTVSKDGGTPEVIPTSSPYTPTDPGTYVFHYEVKHSDPRVTDCYSEVSKTIIVEPCGTVATLSTDKTVLKVGETAKLTYNSPASGETKLLTYTKDGGPAQPAATTPSPYTFAPTETGEYVFTYTITPSGCQATSQSVTINVYDCGPEASISVSQTMIQPGGTVNLTLSALGADETATLTYSKDGGAAQPFAISSSPLAFSPTEEGTYVFTYTITHAYIDCSRSAQVTVRAYNCGAPAGLTVSKNALKLSESTQLTISRLPNTADGETASLSYTYNGGAAQTLTYDPSPITFTPDAVGTYIFTYSIENTTLGCATSAQVTVNVYDCGPEAAITSDKEVLKVGESASLTLSAPGANETATLSYTKDGGAAQPLALSPSPLAFTPTEAGTYVITYAITHAYIDCSRSAQVTIRVYDCGVPAAILASKTVLKLGESTTLTLSAVGADETATLSYSKDGGAAQPLALSPSPLAFTPDAVGTYVFTYTVSHNVIDCETSAQVTVKVYECGPNPAITLSTTEQKVLRPVTITLSEPGAGETGSLTVSINGGAAQTITNNQSPITYTPTELGEYIFTYTITHPYIDCERSAAVTLNVVEAELVFDDKNGTHVWSDPQNWWPAYNRVPNIGDSAIIRKSCQVDIDNAVTKDLTIDMTGGTALTIQPAGALLVVQHILQAQQGQILVQADANHNGALVVGPGNTDLPAGVVFYARSENKEDLYPVWQYMGSPLQEPLNIDQSFQGAVFYEWTNIPNRQTGGNWQRIDSLNGSLMPFTGYCMTQTRQKTYTLQGTLNNPVRQEITLPHNNQGQYPDFAFVANSWVAPIDITALDVADFGAADATVYIMNTGTYEEAIQQQSSASISGTGTARGQYNTIPVHAASYIAGSLTVIPPMQGFFVHTKQPTTLVLDYSKAVFTPALVKVNTTPTRAPQMTNDQSPITTILRLRVEGYGAEDEVYLLASPSFTDAFDNGWDGYKARSDKSPISLAVASSDGNLAVAAIPELEGTEMSFDGGNHKTYTITVTGNPSPVTEDLYLLDKESGVYTELTDGATYTFKCGADTRSFRIVSLNGDEDEQKVNAEKFIQNGILYIRQGNRLYNGTGKLLYIEKDR